ncbi:RecQ-mediated genome instability protein 1 [Vanrija pseudolonga]|uniref:RecQ-mediated genome instability protein 1 n=1 Tax=Vanrija pseudolonga TaxID=143232 RepID=A0AAF1BSF2_9TREE|nr:RecQ-mediated genome instability protein 1 [Vanrija pseudolonga]
MPARRDPAQITTFLQQCYPFPPPDPSWVSECIDALLQDGQDATREAVQEQYIHADLGASSLPAGEGIPGPDDIEAAHGKTLFPRGLLVQVHSVTEVGASAFQLQTALDARRDVLSGASRIRRMDDEEDVVEEGKVPPYPRHMLKLEVSDGRTLMYAIEYRSLPRLGLGDTKLGCKLLIKNVRCLRGTLLLAPDNTTVVGGWVDALDEHQAASFVGGLEQRLEAAKNGSTTAPRRRRTMPLNSRGGGQAARGSSSRGGAPQQTPRSAAAARAARLAAIRAAQEEDELAAGGVVVVVGDDNDSGDEYNPKTTNTSATTPGRPTTRASVRASQHEVIEISD